MYKNGLLLFVTMGLLGCAADGGQRWIGAQLWKEQEDVVVNGSSYRIYWISRAGGFDFKSHYNSTFGIPDEISNKQKNKTAVMQVAQRLCGGRAAIIDEARIDGSEAYLSRANCEQARVSQN